MKIYVHFKIDVKKSAYISKKAMSAEPYYQISAIITVNKTKIHYFTGYSAQKSAWFNSAADANKGDGNRTHGIHKGCLAKKGTRIVQYSEVNKALDLISATMITLSNEHNSLSRELIIGALDKALGKTPRKKCKEIEVKPDIVEEVVSNEEPIKLWEFAELYCFDNSVSNGRNKTRINTINHFRRFQRYRGKEITFADCNAKLLTDFNVFLDQDEGQNDTTLNPRHRARKKNYRTISKIMTCIKHFFKWCRKHYGITDFGNIGDYTAPPVHYGDPIVMTQEEKRKLWDTVFDDESLEYTRDLFYFQCSIGCRISDYFQLRYENIVEEDGRLCIYYCPDKTVKATSITCRIPLTPNAADVFYKYRIEDAHPKTPLFHFPKHSQTYNRQLKRMFKAAGLDRQVVTYNSYNQMEIKRLYDIAISKFARSNFIDTMVGKGVPDSLTGTMSGHIFGSRAFHRYHNRQKSQQQNEAIAMLD